MHCPLARHFCPKSPQKKIEKNQQTSLKLIANDYKSDYTFLLNEKENSAMEINGMCTLAL